MIGTHGHVVPRPDGAKARCGGPALCAECAREAAQLARSRPASVPVAVLEALASAWEDQAAACPGSPEGEGSADALAGCARMLREAITSG